MNDAQLEELLRRAPRPQVPEGLLQSLEREIVLPRRTQEARPASGWSSFWQWRPALSLGVLVLAGLVALGVQTIQVTALRRENAGLRQASQELEARRRADAELPGPATVAQTLHHLRADNQELHRLRAEVAALRQHTAELARVQAENQRLLAERAAAQQGAAASATAYAAAVDEFFERQKAKALAIQCVNNLKQIGLAARIWAHQHGDILPADFASLAESKLLPKQLVCPADTARTAAADWAAFGPASVSYELLSPGFSERDPAVVYARCPIHGNLGLVDGSVHQRREAVQQDGKWVMAPPANSQ